MEPRSARTRRPATPPVPRSGSGRRRRRAFRAAAPRPRRLDPRRTAGRREPRGRVSTTREESCRGTMLAFEPMPKRCEWVPADQHLYLAYHDEEWGVPVHDAARLFEMLTLEGAQASVSLAMLLKKCDGTRVAAAE